MKKRKCIFHKIAVFLLCAAMAGDVFVQTAMAEPEDTTAPTAPAVTGIQQTAQPEQPAYQQVFLERYELTNEKVVPGNRFTLNLFLKNTGKKDANGVVVEVLNPKGVLPVYGTISQAVISVAPGETAQVVLEYDALEKIDASVLDFQVSIREGNMRNTAVLRTSVGTKSPFNVIATFVPARAMVDENVNCSITFKNHGKETADRVRARMDVNGQPVHTSEIGNLPKETTKTQSLFTTFKEPGKYVVELYLDYQDQSGEENAVLVGTSLLEVLENRGAPVKPGNINSQVEEEIANQLDKQFDNTKVLIISGGLIVVIFLIIVFLMKKKK